MMIPWAFFMGAALVFALASVFVDTDPDRPLYCSQMSIAACILAVVWLLVGV